MSAGDSETKNNLIREYLILCDAGFFNSRMYSFRRDSKKPLTLNKNQKIIFLTKKEFHTCETVFYEPLFFA